MGLTTWIPLLAIPPAVGAAVWLVRRKDWFPGRRRRVLATTSAAVALLLVAVCNPAVDVRRAEAPTVIFIGDASPSMRGGQPWPEAAAWVRRELPGSVRFGIVGFSGSAQVVAAPGGRAPAAVRLEDSVLRGPATNIEQAIRSAMALPSDPARTALLLYSDGWETDGSALEAAAEARGRGFRLYSLPPAKPPAPPNAGLVDLRYPSVLSPGQKARLRVAVRSNRGGPVTVALVGPRAGGGEVPRDEQTALLRAETTRWVEFPLELAEAGLHRLEIELSGPAEDAVPEDDRWAFGVRVGRRRPLLVVTYTPERAEADRPPVPLGADQPAETVDAAQMPVSAAALGEYAAVVLYDVPAHALSGPALEALAEYVRDMGGGLVALGGANSFGLGGYARSPLDDMLPVASDPEDRPPVWTAVALDRSASMAREVRGSAKLALAKEAVLEISTLLDEKDRVGLVAFNHEPRAIAEAVGIDSWRRLRSALGSLRPAGGTRIGPALEMALEMLGRSPEKAPDGKRVRRHVIAVSDGIVVGDDGRPPFDLDAMVARATELRATVSLVLTGQSGAWPGLRLLAERCGGRFYDISGGLFTPTGGNRLARIFLEDLELPLLETEPATVTMRDRPPLWPAGAPAQPFPDVPQHIATDAKRRAAVHLSAGEKSRPLAATWPYGLGRAVAWPLPWQKAGAEWLASPRVAEAVAASLRWAARGPVGEADYDVSVSARGGRLAVSVEQRDLAGAPAAVPAMALTLSATGAERPRTLDLEPTGPGLWRLERPIPPGVYGYALAAGGAEGRRLVRRGSLSTGPSLEFRHLDNNERFLARLAEVGGGGLLRAPSDAARMVIAATRRATLWPYLVALAGLLVVYESLRALFGRSR